ncbi:MAG TPA: LYR motif-containing protein [Nocardioidaceae bacterium]|jgi:hypothetical protein
MRVTTAQLPGPDKSDDRIFIGPDVVIMLDGASAFEPAEVTAADYVDHLGPMLLNNLARHQVAPLVDGLSAAIEQTASTLGLVPGGAPSSTVAIVRVRRDVVDLLVLGDTQIATPDGILIDDRIAGVGTEHRSAYRARLREGRGYDSEHRALLRQLQQEQRRHRNRHEGYWIAEADPTAAAQSIVDTRDRHRTPWLVLATDGAYRSMIQLGIDDWSRVADRNDADLTDLLSRCREWEAEADPDGIELPRAKRHDDKSLAAIRVNND